MPSFTLQLQLAKDRDDDESQGVWDLFSFWGLGIAFMFNAWLNYKHQSYSITFNDGGIWGNYSRQRGISCRWSEVESITAKRFEWNIALKSGEIHRVSLADLTYDQHTTLKLDMLKFAESQGVTVRAAA
jgi:hypothetical protein